MRTEQLNVVVVDDHLVRHSGIRLLLRGEAFRIAGVDGEVCAAQALLEGRRYEVALISVRTGATNDDLAVLSTGNSDPESRLKEAVRTSARGFVLKSSPTTRLIDALRIVASGGQYFDPGLAALLATGRDRSRVPMLTAREREIVDLLAEGLTGQAIAARLFLSPETVRTHIRNATTRLGARTRVQAVAIVVRDRHSVTYSHAA